MISILSIGIQKYENSNLNEIKCASLDSLKVYDAFKDILSEEFSEHTSICLTNISSDDFKNVLSTYRCSLPNAPDPNILIIYFSGHAKTLNNNNFVLCFSDFNNGCRGHISIDEIAITLNDISCEKIIILDCCFSGNGLKIANNEIFEHRVSIITSSNQNTLADFDEHGSKFTKHLCESIYEIKSENIDFTLNELQNRINVKHSGSCFNMGAGSTGSIMLRKKANLETTYYDFDKRFYNRIIKSDTSFREASWYFLSGLPFNITEKVYKDIFMCFNPDSKYPLEASWLVRRAIGSSISCIKNKHNRLSIAQELMRSSYWQEQCIGIIGARYDFENDDNLFNWITESVKNKLITKIDAVWLANLYTAENSNYDFNVYLNSSLATNTWGIQEIYCTASKHGISLDIFNDCLSNILKEAISDHQKNAITNWQNIYSTTNNNHSVLHDVINQQGARGRLPKNSKAKFILSTLYRNWRGSKSLNLRSYFETQNSSKIAQELKDSANFVEVEFRMAIFDYLINHSDLTSQYYDHILWGLSDTHPWVRRTAIQAFRAANVEQEIINNSIFNYFENSSENNIGEFDLILEYIENNTFEESKILDFIDKNFERFSVADRNSVAFSMYNRY